MDSHPCVFSSTSRWPLNEPKDASVDMQSSRTASSVWYIPHNFHAFLHCGVRMLLIMCAMIHRNFLEPQNLTMSTSVYHGGQGRVQAGLCLAVICIAVLVAAAVIDKTDL